MHGLNILTVMQNFASVVQLRRDTIYLLRVPCMLRENTPSLRNITSNTPSLIDTTSNNTLR